VGGCACNAANPAVGCLEKIMDCAALLQYMAFYRIGLIKRIPKVALPSRTTV
jgi:hypothetical protein